MPIGTPSKRDRSLYIYDRKWKIISGTCCAADGLIMTCSGRYIAEEGGAPSTGLGLAGNINIESAPLVSSQPSAWRASCLEWGRFM